MKEKRIEVRKNNYKLELYQDALFITCLIIGGLLNILLFIKAWWICDTVLQIVVVFIITTLAFGYGLYKITEKIINLIERRLKQ